MLHPHLLFHHENYTPFMVGTTVIMWLNNITEQSLSFTTMLSIRGQAINVVMLLGTFVSLVVTSTLTNLHTNQAFTCILANTCS